MPKYLKETIAKTTKQSSVRRTKLLTPVVNPYSMTNNQNSNISNGYTPYPLKSSTNSLSLVDSDMLTIATRRSILAIFENSRFVHEPIQENSFDDIINHLLKYSFCNNLKYINEPEFLTEATKAAFRYHELIHSHPTLDLTISEARQIADSVIGKRKKVIKKRKSLIDDKELEDEERDYEQHMFYDALFYLICIALRHNEYTNYFYSNSKYLEIYGDIHQPIGTDELETIVCFRNFMKLAMLIIPAAGNKGYLLDFITRLVEGSHKKYITGSGATIETKRRVKIYETEGNISIAVRPERRKIKEAKMLGLLGKLRPSDPMFTLTTKSSRNMHSSSNSLFTETIKYENICASIAVGDNALVSDDMITQSDCVTEREAAESILSIFQTVSANSSQSDPLYLKQLDDENQMVSCEVSCVPANIESRATCNSTALSIQQAMPASQDSIIWEQAVKRFSKEKSNLLNRNHSLI